MTMLAPLAVSLWLMQVGTLPVTRLAMDVVAGRPDLAAEPGVGQGTGTVSVTASWNAPTTGGAPTTYTVSVDGVVVPNGTVPATTLALTFPIALGQHSLSVIASNSWGDSPPATLAVNVAPPGMPTLVNLKRGPGGADDDDDF